jgi:hypothetical protein
LEDRGESLAVFVLLRGVLVSLREGVVLFREDVVSFQENLASQRDVLGELLCDRRQLKAALGLFAKCLELQGKVRR